MIGNSKFLAKNVLYVSRKSELQLLYANQSWLQHHRLCHRHHDQRSVDFKFKGSPPQIHEAGIWALPVRGGRGGLNPCPDGLGQFFF